MITIVGLGNSPLDLTLGGVKVIEKAKSVYVRTFKTKAGKNVLKIRPDALSFDEQFDNAEDFDSLNKSILDILSSLEECVFCVDGSGVDDGIVTELAKTVKLNYVLGVSEDSKILSSRPSRKYSALYAMDIISSSCFYPVDVDLLVKEIDDKYLASDLKLRLLDAYGDVDIIYSRENDFWDGKISELDRQKKYGNTFSILVPYRDFIDKKRFSFTDLLKIVFRLRAPDGCPWDRVQTHQSIRNCCLEEAYELVEAIDLDDLDKMTEEAGDVLLQGVFHASIAESTGEFTVTDVISGICNKLIGRHLHIFGNEKAMDDKEAYAIWEKAKAKEKSQRTYTQRMKQVAEPLPALMKGNKISKYAVKSGFSSSRDEFYIDKVKEEFNEFLSAKTQAEREEEAGDMLLAFCSLASRYDIEPELALMGAISKFIDRFERLENTAKERNIDLKALSEADLLALYNEVKNA